MLKKFKLRTRILFLGTAIIFFFVLLLALYVRPKFVDNMYQAKREKTQHLVESAWTVIDHFSKAASSGAMTEEQAKSSAIAVIKNLRYDGAEYFWIKIKQLSFCKFSYSKFLAPVEIVFSC